MIAKQDLDQLMNQATVKLTGASDKGIRGELYDVLTEFFDISSSWVEHVLMDGLANVTTYSIVPEEGQIIRFGGACGSITYPTVAAYRAALALDPTIVRGLSPLPATMEEFGTMVLYNNSGSPMVMRVTVLKNVALPTTKDMTPIGPDWVLPKFGRYILDGVLGKMMGQPNKSYTNDTLSVYHLKRFQEGISRARTATLTANVYGGQAWSFPRQYKTRGQRGYTVANTAGF